MSNVEILGPMSMSIIFKSRCQYPIDRAKYAKNAKIKNHPISTNARTQKVKPGVVKLIPASKLRELDPFQHPGVEQHPLEPRGIDL